MRLIKFRGKDKKYGNWFFGNLYNRDIYGRTHICTTNNGSLNIDPNTVGQFTGLYDKNGKEIYEGDLLECDEVPKILSEVYWNCSMSAFCLAVHTITEGIDYGTTPLGDVLSKFKSLHIIDNIHDNPELLKGGKE